MKIIFSAFCFVLYLISVTIVHAQAPSSSVGKYIDNLILVANTYDLYGFIVGSEGRDKDLYFVIVKETENFENHVKTLYNKGKDVNEATLVETPFKIGTYYVGLYMIGGGAHKICKKYYQTTNGNGGDYYIFRDKRKSIGGSAAMNRTLDASINYHETVTRNDDANNYEKEQITFSTTRPGLFANSGLPIFDNKGNVSGIIAENQLERSTTFYVLDIVPIRNKLVELGKKKGNECKYFNLIENNAPHDETPCEQYVRRQNELKKQAEIAEAERIRQLKQESDRMLDLMVKTNGKRSLDPVQRRMYNRNIDRPFAISLAANANWDLVTIPKTSGAGSGSSSSFSFGANLHINPDKGKFRVTLKPRYCLNNIKVVNGYNYGTSAAEFSLTKVTSVSYEMPIMLELLTSRAERKNVYWGLGYAPGLLQSVDFRFNTKDEKDRSQHVIMKPLYLNKIILETGLEGGRMGISIYLGYQFSEVVKNDYEIILGGETIKPLKDVPKNYYSLGIHVYYRLWNQWRNNYRTMF
ncbi:hypothetical protein SAMN05518672_101867 [Chitinophaga sp. CF118]|uniref:hypothetical protein n=1 Tax=Chitinophaga sp. CF118 TaxID=1884367 RepID=UPI0008E92D35|nr:hypothetical protein [Chitinophaga sp. CF118]SFD17257.1 hypothetical protein SAMN05518672_101867 [Chitinophaga sp. CF118]